ncbi:MAG: hypothetical protein WC351_04130 [Candidatus Izemoplasmatales bacterium]|jgi:hypothetical protein
MIIEIYHDDLLAEDCLDQPKRHFAKIIVKIQNDYGVLVDESKHQYRFFECAFEPGFVMESLRLSLSSWVFSIHTTFEKRMTLIEHDSCETRIYEVYMLELTSANDVFLNRNIQGSFQVIESYELLEKLSDYQGNDAEVERIHQREFMIVMHVN